MVSFYGDYNTAETVNIPFNAFSSDDPSASVTITNLAAGDVEIHKDGSVTQRASDNGVTVSIDFDGVTGNHMVHIDLSDNSDAGFYANGSRYQVRIEGTTIDGATVNAWIGCFSIGCTLRPTTAGRTLDIQATGEVDANLTMLLATALTETAGGYLAAAFKKLFDVETPVLVASDVMRGTDSAALASIWTEARAGALTDWIDGGRLDLLLDAIPTTPMRGTDSAALASIWTEARAGALTDWIDGGRLDLLLDAIPTTPMRGTDSAALASIWTEARAGALTDWIDGGRLDTLLDTAAGGSTGAGARTITVTVDDGADPLEGARLRFTKGGETYVGSTNAAGQVLFSLDDGTWAVAITLPLYTFTPTTLAVSDDAAPTYSMTAVSVPASDPGRVTGYLYVYDEEAKPESGVTIDVQQRTAVSGSGVGYDSALRSDTSDEDGLVTFAGLFPGGGYRIRRESGTWHQFTIAAGATDPYTLPSILGP